MGWIYLLFAGIFEVCFTTFLKLSAGFSKFYPSVFFVLFAILSFWLLNKSLATIPLGTSYAVWTGIGAFGTALVGVFFFHESTDFWRIFFILCLIVSIIGLKLVAKH
ncbi:MAG: multidrug efflux SMR transporter [Pseudomonadota bacterium]